MKFSMAVRLGLAFAGVLMAGFAIAQGSGGGDGSKPGFGEHRPPFERALGPQGDHGRWWNNPRVAERLKLTDEQRKAMDDILLQHREQLVDLKGAVEKAELEMEPLMSNDQPNESRILAQIDKVAQARAELEKANARFLLAIRGKLTADQWKQLQADRANRGQEHGWGQDGRGRGGEGRGPGGQDRRQGPPPPQPPPGAPQPAGPQGSVEPGAGPQDPPSRELGAEQ